MRCTSLGPSQAPGPGLRLRVGRKTNPMPGEETEEIPLPELVTNRDSAAAHNEIGREQPSFRSRVSSNGGSTNRTIYFEYQREKKVVGDNEEVEVDLSYWDRMQRNWVTFVVIGILLIITLVCALIEVREAPFTLDLICFNLGLYCPATSSSCLWASISFHWTTFSEVGAGLDSGQRQHTKGKSIGIDVSVYACFCTAADGNRNDLYLG